MIPATAEMSAAFPTDVPPNFMTNMDLSSHTALH